MCSAVLIYALSASASAAVNNSMPIVIIKYWLQSYKLSMVQPTFFRFCNFFL